MKIMLASKNPNSLNMTIKPNLTNTAKIIIAMSINKISIVNYFLISIKI